MITPIDRALAELAERIANRTWLKTPEEREDLRQRLLSELAASGLRGVVEQIKPLLSEIRYVLTQCEHPSLESQALKVREALARLTKEKR